MKIKDVLNIGITRLKENNIEESNLKARMLLSNLMNKNKEYLMIYSDEEVNSNIENRYFEGINELIQGKPIQYIINYQQFMGIDFFVNEDVLIPQPDTEILVEEVLKLINKNNKILDLCTGTGAIAISLYKLSDEPISIYASDISSKALEVAKINASKNFAQINFINSDLFNEININCFDIIVSNPPYIETNEIMKLSKEVQNEPQIALDGGIDGLKFYNEIALNAKKYLNKNGYLAFEIGYNQKEAVEKILKNNNYSNIYCVKDLANNNRVIIAQY